MSIPQYILSTLIILALALASAHLLIRRGSALLGFLAGIAVLGLYQLYLLLRLRFTIHNCLASACASSGLPPGCAVGTFGCTEWAGLAVFIFVATGLVQSVIFLVIAGFLLWRQKHSTPRQALAQED